MRPTPSLAASIAVLVLLALPTVGSASTTNTRIVSGPSGTVSTDSVTFAFDSPEDGGFECRLDSSDPDDWHRCSSPQSYASLAGGPHRFEVRALNRGWQPDPTPAVATFTIDTTPPETTIDAGPVGTIASDSASFSFTASEAGDFQCRLDSVDDSAWAPCGSPQSYPGLADGSHSFEVRAEDAAGNVDPTPAVADFAVDTTPPQTAIETAPVGTIASASASFSFTDAESGSFECRLDSAEESAWAPCTSPQSYSGLADGPHSFEVRGSDESGNVDPTPAVATFAIDTTPPQTTIDSGPSGTIEATSATFAFTSSEAGGFQCRLDSTDASGWSPCTAPRTYSSLGGGSHDFEVRAVDESGNVDPSPATAGFSVYTGPPKPVAGQTLDVEPVEGTVELQCPGESAFEPLTAFKQIPVGCLINTRHGTVDLTASKGSSGDLQGAHFWGGVFIATQNEGDNQEVDLKLAGRRMCERRGSNGKPVAQISASGKHGRRLWGSGKGNYSTSGSYGSATVRGTTWLVIDRCDASTLIKVAEGVVAVRDLIKEKSHTLTAGQQYIAKAPIPRLNPDTLP